MGRKDQRRRDEASLVAAMLIAADEAHLGPDAIAARLAAEGRRKAKKRMGQIERKPTPAKQKAGQQRVQPKRKKKR